MVQGYYTLEEAAQILGMEVGALRQMADRREIRAFADRGTFRFRTQDVEELGRRMGIGSDPELQPGEAPASSKSSGKIKTSGVRKKTTGGDDFFEFELSGSSDELSIELDDPGAMKKKTNLAGGSGKDKKTGLSEDPDGIDAPIGFLDDGGSPSGRKRSKTGGASSGKLKAQDPDSGLRLVPTDDEGVPLPSDFSGKPDSDVKLDPAAADFGTDAGDLPPTEEVRLDLDADLQLEDAPAPAKKSSGKLSPPKAEGSPFELSEEDLELDLGGADTNKAKTKVAGGSSRKVTQAPADDDDEVSLGDLTIGDGDFSGASGASGINLHVPADTGVNLERANTGSDDDVEFELSLDGEGDDLVSGPSTAKGLKSGVEETGSSESEFELTLGEDGGLQALDEPPGPSDSTEEVAGEEKDIFETDFEIPALDDESGSEVAAVEESDTDLESSDFEFDPTAADEELEDSGSQVVALDEEGEESGSQVMAIEEEEEEGGSVVVSADDEDELADISEPAEDEDEEESEELVEAGAGLAPAPWGAVPTIFMLPCVVVMSLLSLMTYEMLHGMWGYRQPNKPATLILRPAAELFGQEPAKD